MFTQRLQRNARLVEKRLHEWLIPCDSRIPRRLVEAMRHGALAGGKRLRPHLLIESAALFGISAEDALDAAVALECAHCYSLIHDDLPAMDDDDMRRGQPTVHRAFDEGTAILAGDALLTLAFEIMAAETTHPDPAIRVRLMEGLARAAGWAGMAGGQMLDLQAPDGDFTIADVEQLQAMKTGALVRFACEAGAILGGAECEEFAALSRYGQAAGAAFQLADDLLDAQGDPAKLGKATAKDEAAGKATLVGLLGVANAQARLRFLEHEAKKAVALFGERARPLVETAAFIISREY